MDSDIEFKLTLVEKKVFTPQEENEAINNLDCHGFVEGHFSRDNCKISTNSDESEITVKFDHLAIDIHINKKNWKFKVQIINTPEILAFEDEISKFATIFSEFIDAHYQLIFEGD